MIKWCAMHILNLGVALWIGGNCMQSIAEDYDWWGDRATITKDDLLALAYERFRQWTKERKIGYLDHPLDQ